MGMMRGPVSVFESGRYGYVMDIVVGPVVRRSGVGQALFEALEAWFRDRRGFYA